MRLNAIITAILYTILLALPAAATADAGYAEKAGKSAGVYRDAEMNFQLDLDSTSYVIVDFTEQMPEASFAAMRFDPLVFTMTIAEDLGIEMSTEQYAEITKSSTIADLLSADESGSTADVAVSDDRLVMFRRCNRRSKARWTGARQITLLLRS